MLNVCLVFSTKPVFFNFLPTEFIFVSYEGRSNENIQKDPIILNLQVTVLTTIEVFLRVIFKKWGIC